MEIKIIKILNNNGDYFRQLPNDKPIIVDCGYIIADKFDEDECLDLCNWSNWRRYEGKPENLHSDICVCNSDVAFLNPDTNIWYVEKHVGWGKCRTKKEAIEILKKSSKKWCYPAQN